MDTTNLLLLLRRRVLLFLCFHNLTNCLHRNSTSVTFVLRPSCTPWCAFRLFRVFSNLRALFALLPRFLHTRPFVFSGLHALLQKHPGGGYQRGRGRKGGRAVSGRGRIRKRGPSGGGTLRSDSPQQGQRPSSQNARVASARSQWPRASHCGLMHCTVKPGRNCMSF